MHFPKRKKAKHKNKKRKNCKLQLETENNFFTANEETKVSNLIMKVVVNEGLL